MISDRGGDAGTARSAHRADHDYYAGPCNNGIGSLTAEGPDYSKNWWGVTPYLQGQLRRRGLPRPSSDR